MKDVVGIRFKKPGKIYFFDPGFLQLKVGDKVIVETPEGEDIGEVAIDKKPIDEEKNELPINNIIRLVNAKDMARVAENKIKEQKAFNVCQNKIKEHNLEMNLVEVECKFNNSKIIFYFTADGRIDFRELVKELATIYKTRIEMRQIGVRDEVRKIGGNGVCGRELCCCSFLNNFDIVSIKMAKEQSVSLNPSKISGCCGRLMCCLKYEQEAYEDKLKKLPKVGSIVKTEDGEGTVERLETLKEKVNVKFKDGDGFFYKKYDVKDIKIIKSVSGSNESYDQEEIENLKELNKLEALEKQDKKNKGKQEDYE